MVHVWTWKISSEETLTLSQQAAARTQANVSTWTDGKRTSIVHWRASDTYTLILRGVLVGEHVALTWGENHLEGWTITGTGTHRKHIKDLTPEERLKVGLPKKGCNCRRA